MIRAAVREAFAITIPELMNKIYEVAQNAERDGDKLRAYELIGRHLGAFADVSPAGRTSAILHVINVPANNRAVIDLQKIESLQPFLTNNKQLYDNTDVYEHEQQNETETETENNREE
jgi:hypothetical protein